MGEGRSQQPFPELKDGQPRKDGRYPNPLRGRHPFSMDQHRAQQPRDGHQEREGRDFSGGVDPNHPVPDVIREECR